MIIGIYVIYFIKLREDISSVLTKHKTSHIRHKMYEKIPFETLDV